MERTLAAQFLSQRAGAAKAIDIISRYPRFGVPPTMPKPPEEKFTTGQSLRFAAGRRCS
jgi:hypothetical protein